MLQKSLVQYGLLLSGTALLAVGVQIFLEPAGLVAGGISGLGMILDDVSQKFGGPMIPLWLVNTVCNVPLFVWAWRIQGRQFVGRTILTSLLFSVMLYFASLFPYYHGDFFTAAAYGGILSGAGLGLVLRGGATTGGVDLAAAVLHHSALRHISLPTLVFLLDAAIILLGMVTFGATHTLYAVLSVGIMEKVMHITAEGIHGQRAAIIFSEHGIQVKDALVKQNIFALIAQRQMFVQKEQQWVVFCVFSQKELPLVKSILINIDRNAFFLVADIREVLGEQSFSG